MIIGLSGYARSGKDTVADRLVTSHGFTRIGFADALRDALYALDPWIPDNNFTGLTRLASIVDTVGWERAKDEHPEVRILLQRLGTEVGRNLWGEDFWVDRLAEKVFHLTAADPDLNVVIPDCRFPNEAVYVQMNMAPNGAPRGELWRITRPGYAPVNPHPSETALNDWSFDTFISNDKTVAALHEHVDYLVEKLNGSTTGVHGRG